MTAPRHGALVGFGGVAEHGHLPGYSAHGGFRIRAVAEPIAAGRERAAEALGAAGRVHADLADCLAAGDLEFVDICAPPAHHLPAIERAAAAGLHVLVEKPLALAPDEARRAVAACEAAGTALVVVHNWHHAPMFRAARDAIEQGAVGAPREVEFITERTEPASGGGASWRLDKKVAGGGILVDHGWHQLYVARALLGGAEPEHVRARIETRRWHEASVEDSADAEVTYADGSRARLRLTWAADARRTEVIVRGESGEIRIEGGRVRVEPQAGGARDWPVAADAPDDSYHATWFPQVLELFEAALRDPAAAAANTREALLNQATLDAAYRSGEAGGEAVTVADRLE